MNSAAEIETMKMARPWRPVVLARFPKTLPVADDATIAPRYMKVLRSPADAPIFLGSAW